jgi:hypothetical protein
MTDPARNDLLKRTPKPLRTWQLFWIAAIALALEGSVSFLSNN